MSNDESATLKRRFSKAAARQWSVFPLPPLCKIPERGVSWKEYQTSHANPFEIAEWDDTHDNVAIATGSISGFVVLDLDNDAALARLIDIRHLPETVTVKTPRGYHFYFRYPDAPVGNKAGLHKLDAELPEGLDFRGDGGFIVGHGSYYVPTDEESAKGKQEGPYRFVAGSSPDDVELAELPEWLFDLVKEKPFVPIVGETRDIPDAYAAKALDGEVQKVLTAPRGTRNDTLNQAAFALGQLVASGALDRATVEADLYNAGRSVGQGHDEARSTIRSGLNQGMRSPRQLPEREPEVQHAARAAEKPAGEARPPFGASAFRASQVADIDVPEQEWVVDDLIPMGAVTTLFGDGGVGKSLAVQTIASHIAAGEPFADRPVKKLRVAAIMCEDDDAELNRRQRRINARFFAEEEVEDFIILSRVGEDNVLGSIENNRWAPSVLYAEIEEWVEREAISVLIIDNIMQVFGGDINDNQAVTWFVNSLTRLARRMNGAVILLGHIAKAESSRFSGSMAWNNSVRARLNLSKAEAEAGKPERRVLTVDKSNYGKAGITIELALYEGVLIDVNSLSQGELSEAAQRMERTRAAIITLLRTIGSFSMSHQSEAYVFNQATRMKLARLQVHNERDVRECVAAMLTNGTLVKRLEYWTEGAKRKTERVVLNDQVAKNAADGDEPLRKPSNDATIALLNRMQGGK